MRHRPSSGGLPTLVLVPVSCTPYEGGYILAAIRGRLPEGSGTPTRDAVDTGQPMPLTPGTWVVDTAYESRGRVEDAVNPHCTPDRNTRPFALRLRTPLGTVMQWRGYSSYATTLGRCGGIALLVSREVLGRGSSASIRRG